MPYSTDVFDSNIKKILTYLKPSRVFDIGCGAGKYGQLINELKFDCFVEGVEIEKDYIEKFGLRNFYNKVNNTPVQNIISGDYVDTDFGLVIMGDVIEHLKKSEGQDILNFLVYRSSWIVILYPQKYLQNSVGGYISEAHISVWGESDFALFDRTPIFENGDQRMLVIKGYLNDGKSLGDLIKIMND